MPGRPRRRDKPSARFRTKPQWGAICSGCLHDLTVRVTAAPTMTRSGFDSDGRVYCSNPSCKFHLSPHPTKSDLNKGGSKL